MCTVTFMPRRTGYCLAMNRDEKRTRQQGLPPSQRNIAGHKVIYPSEPDGGTWIALNEHGVSLALINWYSVAQRLKRGTLSRGGVIPSVSTEKAADFIDAGLNDLPLDRINPFRLICALPASREVIEWRWDLERLVRHDHQWELQQWVSSGLDEPRAQDVRGGAFQEARRQQSTASLIWLRRLHRSHLPQEGPFSICMHREDAVTVSYTEVSVFGQQVRMDHVLGAPCNCSTVSRQFLRTPSN